MNNQYASKEAMSEYLNTPEGEDYLDKYRADMYEIDTDNKITDAPYWCDKYANQPEDYKVQYVPGYYENKHYGDYFVEEGVSYKYIDSICLGEEVEFQLDDDSFYVHNIGTSFLRVLQAV